MAVTQATQDHSGDLGHTLLIITLAVALVVAVFAGGALAFPTNS